MPRDRNDRGIPQQKKEVAAKQGASNNTEGLAVHGESLSKETKAFKEIYEKVLKLRGLQIPADEKGKAIDKVKVIQELNAVEDELSEFRKAQNDISNITRKLKLSKDTPKADEQSSSKGKGSTNKKSAGKTPTPSTTKYSTDASLIEEEVDKLLKKLKDNEETLENVRGISKTLRPSSEETNVQASKPNTKGNKNTGKKDQPSTVSQTKPTSYSSDVQTIRAEVERLKNEIQKYEEVFQVLSNTKNQILPPEQENETAAKGRNKDKTSKDKQKNPPNVPKTKDPSHAEGCKTVAVDVQTEVTKMINEIETLEKYIQRLNDMIPTSEEGTVDAKKKKTAEANPTANPDKLISEKALQKLCSKFKNFIDNSKKIPDHTTGDQNQKKKQVLATTNDKKVKKDQESFSKQIDEVIEIAKQQLGKENFKIVSKLADKGNKDEFFPNLMSAVIEEAATKAEIERKCETMETENIKMRACIVGIVKDESKLQLDSLIEKANRVLQQLEKEKDDYRLLMNQVELDLPEAFRKCVDENKGNGDIFLDLMKEVIEEAALKSKIESEIGKLKTENEEHEKFKQHVLSTTEEAVQNIASRNTNKKQIKLKLDADTRDTNISSYNAALSKLLAYDQQKTIDENAYSRIKQLKEENEHLQTRLSKIAGTRLTENNPSITNLGDPNRPMKIGEMYSELYDNEWTDLMDKLEAEKKKPDHEDKILQALCGTLLTCSKYCYRIDKELQEQETKLADILLFDKKKKTSTNAFREYRGSSLVAVDDLIQVIRTDSKGHKDFLKELKLGKDVETAIYSSTFFEKCLRLCWSMVILQQPPMVVEEAGKTINKDRFREYTKSGTKILFTVWPALLLHKDGPVLVKGVMKMK